MFIFGSKARSKQLYNVALLALLVLGIVGSTGVSSAQAPTALEMKALEAVARRTGIPVSELELLYSTSASYPLQGRSATLIKVSDQHNRAIYGVLLDPSGQELDEEQLLANERAAYNARYGKLTPELAERLAQQDTNAPIEVRIWLKQPRRAHPMRPQPGAPITRSQLDAFRAQVDRELARDTRSVVTPIVQRLARLGYASTADTYAPRISATLPATVIREVSRWAEVDRIYERETAASELSIARKTMGVENVNALFPVGRNITGAGVKVAMLEVDGSVETANPYLHGVTQPTNTVCPVNDHATGVAGIIRSTHTTHRGIAPDVNLWAGSECSSVTTEDHALVAADWGARAINLSWGAGTNLLPRDLDYYYDRMVFTRYITIVKSAGNRGQTGCFAGTDGNITSPGLGYNVLTVGAYNDRFPLTPMEGCSSWRDPSSRNLDREKPEVVAPGTNIMSTGTVSTTTEPWITNIGSGTSFAAPMVTGATALLMQRADWLEMWPEAIKAILMTTALYNIEGDQRLSEKDGAGGIRIDLADDVARMPGHAGGEYYTCSSPPAPRTLTQITLVKGVRTRVTIVWSTDPDHADYTHQPTADLDLIILDARGNRVDASTSADNTYEIVDFVPSQDGDYSVTLNQKRCTADPPWLAWAWYQGK